jgi:hypothetical protein
VLAREWYAGSTRNEAMCNVRMALQLTGNEVHSLYLALHGQPMIVQMTNRQCCGLRRWCFRALTDPKNGESFDLQWSSCDLR